MPAPADQAAASTHLVLIPSYNTGARLAETVADARHYWPAVWVVIDGSTDGSGESLARLHGGDDGVEIIRRERNGGKGAAVLDGVSAAAAAGFTHVLVMDADGQHPAASIPDFMAVSRRHAEAMILGQPVFDRTAPWARVLARRLPNALTRLETLTPIGDSLFGFRVYPLAPLLIVMLASRRMRRFDFDTEAVVRLSWRGFGTINMKVPVCYFSQAEGGVSHYKYGRDNLVLAALHLRLLGGFLARLPRLACRQSRLRDCFRSRSGESHRGEF